jgi:hypothetical protein
MVDYRISAIDHDAYDCNPKYQSQKDRQRVKEPFEIDWM